MLLKAALNGSRTAFDHPALPITRTHLAADAAACVGAGARAIHVHPRDAHGRETMEPAAIDTAVLAIRDATGVPVGVSTGAWIEPDRGRRIAAISRWRQPDMASVNLSEDGAEEVMRAVLDAGIAVEAGIWSLADVDRLAGTGLAMQVTRVLVEIVLDVEHPVAEAERIRAALDRLGIACPLLMHGDGMATWPVLERAVALGLDIRVGLEDTLELPDGSPATGNEQLVRVAADVARRLQGSG